MDRVYSMLLPQNGDLGIEGPFWPGSRESQGVGSGGLGLALEGGYGYGQKFLEGGVGTSLVYTGG